MLGPVGTYLVASAGVIFVVSEALRLARAIQMALICVIYPGYTDEYPCEGGECL